MLHTLVMQEAGGTRKTIKSRRFCGFAAHEPTPERTAFVRFRRERVRRGLDCALFEEVTSQLKAKAVTVKTRTVIDATLMASASHVDGAAAWAGHQRRSAVHGFKAHVSADADTALVEELAVTAGNAHDGLAGGAALPEGPGEVFADSACRGEIFDSAVRTRGGTPRIVATSMWGDRGTTRRASSAAGTTRSSVSASGLRRTSEPGSTAMTSSRLQSPTHVLRPAHRLAAARGMGNLVRRALPLRYPILLNGPANIRPVFQDHGTT